MISDLFNVGEFKESCAVEALSWYCVRSHPKHEHIAAAQLRQPGDIEVFVPRIRYRRATRQGPAWVTEALFKDYFFAKFELAVALRRVRHARSVCGVVHFGDHWPSVPEHVIVELRTAMGGQEQCVVEDGLEAGDRVQINAGAVSGLEAVVTRFMPAKQRVAVLLDFLGRQTTLELDRDQVLPVAAQESQRRRFPLYQQTAALRSR